MASEQKVIFLSGRLDALDEFRSEDVRPVRQDGMIPLADLHAGFSIEWYEALAVVQSVCRAIIDSAEQNGPARVDPHDVLIAEDGAVTVACKGPRNAVAAVQCLGTILDGLLPDHDFMFLRARLVSKATSSPPHYNSLQEFSDAIAYYERPNRAEVVQELYRRFHKLPPQPDAAPRIQQGAVPKTDARKERQMEEERVEVRPEVTRPSRARSVRRALVFGIATGAVAGIVAGVALWMAEHPAASPAQAGATTALDDAVRDRSNPKPATTVREIHNPKKDVEAASSTIAPQPVQSPAIHSQTRSSVQAVIASPGLVYEPAALARDLDLVRLGVTQKPAAPVQPAVARSVPGNPVRLEPSSAGTIYGDTDDDVTPPSVLYPRFPDPAEAKKARADMFLIEVVVNERGDVAMAKARSLPRSISESLFLMNILSSAKSWHFDPAKKGIYPVKYRYLVELAAN